MMRRILVNHAVERKRRKRGGSGEIRVALDEAVTFAEELEINLVELDEALGEPARFSARPARIVELKFSAF